MAGSIQRLDASAMKGREAETDVVFGSGIVKAVDPGEHRIRVSHGPIEDLGWSAMTMEFDVARDIDLGSIEVGQYIHFSLAPSEVGDYGINFIHQAGESR